MTSSVYVPSFMPEKAVQVLHDAGFSVIRATAEDKVTFMREAKEVAGIVASTVRLTKADFEQLPHVKIIARFGVGYDSIDLASAKKHQIIVTNTPGANSVSVAEMTIGLILDHLKKISLLNAHLHETTDFRNHDFGAYRELAGKTVGLVGYGHIAKETAKRLAAFDVNLLIENRTKRATSFGTYVNLDELLTRSDIISLHVPDVAATHHLIDAAAFKKMKKSAILVNTARGGVIDEPALIQALQEKRIAGAALDVFATEPLPADSPLRALPNVTLTPHVAANTTEANERMGVAAAMEVVCVLTGQKPDHQVN